MPRAHRLFTLLALSFACLPSAAAAQSIGTFRWQLFPYCNVVTVAVTQVSGFYRLDGTDNQCGIGNPAALTGEAQLNASGGVSLGFTIVTSPTGRPVHVSADIALPSANGAWEDSTGATGPFVLTIGAPAAGSPRPVPLASNALPWGSTIVIGGPAATSNYGFGVAVTAPAPSSGAALVGQWGDLPASAPSSPSAVRGVSSNQFGVLGASGSSSGVAGTSISGDGMSGESSSGAGVFGLSFSGPGVKAVSGSAGVALEVADGGIRVSGSLRPIFQHTTTSGNVFTNVTIVDHPLLNGRPNALVMVTHVYAPGATVYVPAVGVYYDPGFSRWEIFREDLGAMPLNARFNVLVFNQ